MAYTFKDDGAALTYYREYNKETNAKNETLVGNWVEERALRDQIQTGRYQLWVDNSDDPTIAQKTYTKFTQRPDASDTYTRTLVHSEHTPSAEYCTNNQVPAPPYARYVNPGKGARAQLMEKRAMELAAGSAPAVPELPSQYMSTYLQDYEKKQLPPADCLGRKVMMTQNMIATPGAGDGLWRKEMDVVQRNRVIEDTGGAFDQTFTSQGVKPKYGFGKDATFSTPVEIARTGAEHNS